MRILFISLILISCGKSTIELEDSHHTIDGITKNEVLIKFEPIIQINELCKNLYLTSSFPSIELYNQKVAECTFDKLSIINLNMISDFSNDLCLSGEQYDSLNPAEKLQVDELCKII